MESGAAGPLEPHLAKARPVSVREKPAAPATVSADAQTGTYDHEQSEQNFLRLPMEWLMLLWELELSLVAFARAVLRRLDAALRSAAQVCDQWRSMSGSELRTGERITLEIGFVIILVALSAGLELGRWPAWSGLAAAGGRGRRGRCRRRDIGRGARPTPARSVADGQRRIEAAPGICMRGRGARAARTIAELPRELVGRQASGRRTGEGHRQRRTSRRGRHRRGDAERVVHGDLERRMRRGAFAVGERKRRGVGPA